MADDKTYSKAEVDALIAKAAAKAAGGDDPTKRPYRVIKAPDGTVVCYPPVGTPNAVAPHNGPWTIGDQHPDDWFGVEEQDDGKGGKKLVATQNHGADEAPKSAAPAAAAAPAATTTGGTPNA